MGLLLFVIGFITGVLFVVGLVFLLLFQPSKQSDTQQTFKEQFVPFQIPIELKQLLLSPGAADELKKKESCIGINVLLHFLYQEFRATKWFRRWVLRRLQLEFNDLTSRTAAGKLLQDIRIRDLSVGSQFPVIRRIHIEKAELSDDTDSFEELDLILDVEYRGGFCVSVDVYAMLGRQAFLSVQMTRLSGQARLRLSRNPFSHWTFSFLEAPQIDFKVESRFFGGRPLKQLVPLIIQQFRKAMHRKHVLPNLKIRYRPFFPNPLLQASANPADFEHISVRGRLEVTVRNCSRLNVSSAPVNMSHIYCSLALASRPFLYGSAATSSIHFVSIALKLVRHNYDEPVGLLLSKIPVPDKDDGRYIQVQEVLTGSAADRAGFRTGDLLLALNNQPIRTDRHAVARLLAKTTGELTVLVERSLTNMQDEDDVAERLANNDRLNVTGRDLTDIKFASASPTTPGSLGRARSETDLGSLKPSSPVISITEPLDVSPPTETLRRAHSDMCLDSRANSEERETENVLEESGDTLPSVDTDSCNVTDGVTNPMLSSVNRKERLRARAAETAVNVAQKWAVGKETVRGMLWAGRHRRSGSNISGEMVSPELGIRAQESDTDLTVPEFKTRPTSLSVPNEGSNNEFLVNSDSEIDQPGVSEISVVDGAAKETTPRVPNFPDSTPSAKSSIHRRDRVQELKTKANPIKENVNWNQNLAFDLTRRCRYLNVTLWAESGERSDAEPMLLAYTSQLLPEILDDCSVTLSNYHEQTFALRPPGQANVPSRYAHLMRCPGFDARLCYGDITLGFQWLPQGATENHNNRDETEHIELVQTETLSNCDTSPIVGHNWTQASFTQAVLCAHCKGKIWLKTATQCTKCAVICHNKCQPKANSQLPCREPNQTGELCERVSGDDDMVVIDYNNPSQTDEQEVIDEPIVQQRAGSRRFRLQQKLVQKLPVSIGLRRRKPQLSEEQAKASPVETAIDATDETDTAESLSLEKPDPERSPSTHQPFHTMLYTAGGNFNEHVITAAKDLGKDLFAQCTPSERKAKINEQIDKLQVEIDTTTKDRLSMLQQMQNAEIEPEKTEMTAEFNRLDDRLQALAVLMLHYCAGLQNCMDVEESTAENETDTVELEVQ